MPVVNTKILIERPPAAVFDYVTTPGLWPQWQPAVLALHGVTDRPLRLGERVTVEYNVAGRTGTITWTVSHCREHRYWSVEGETASRSSAGSVSYKLSRHGCATQLARSFTFETSQPIPRLLDALALHRQVALEAEGALAQLKAVLEARG